MYLANIGFDGYYGFCTSDDPGSSSDRQVSAYCVLDNEFSMLEYGAPPLESLQVTAAHEFFHAVQFAYDYWDEIWFMEGTAAWAEELVHDEVDDNYRYLPTSQLAKPWLPLDRTRDNARYGSWVFWQFLTEAFGSAGSPDPTVVREVWERAEGRTPALDALATTTRARGVPFTAVFGYFGVVNLVPEAFYEEGGSSGVSAPVTRSLTLTAARPPRRSGTSSSTTSPTTTTGSGPASRSPVGAGSRWSWTCPTGPAGRWRACWCCAVTGAWPPSRCRSTRPATAPPRSRSAAAACGRCTSS